MNAHRDILRKMKRQRGDQDMSNVTVQSKKPQSTDIEVVLQTTPAGAWDFIDFKEEFKRGLGKAEGVEGLLTNLSEGRSAIIARKVLEAAEKFWRQDRGLQKVKKKDKYRGRDLMLAYVDLLQKGHANPRMDEITVIFRNLPVNDDEVARMRTETPDRNFHNDIKKSKTLGLASFGKLMQKNKRIIDALAEWAQGNTGRRASMNITQRVAVRYARQLLARHPKGPMSKEDKEKLMEENPKFKEMNEEHGDKFKKKVLDAE